ncbi:MAG: Neutral/alkaline non-lysosomal ceramidase, partial [Verrucomicrobiales bacterium]|nr:Neutral/alkaline non-lysosomal ceramidase [Verrucomicrobiales bacterium]
LADRANSFTPRVRSEAMNTLLARGDRSIALLNAIDAGKLRIMDLTTAQAKFLRGHREKDVRAAALKVLGKPVVSKRQDVIDALTPALTLKGEASHGREIYLLRCSACHRLGGAGSQLGPDLVTVKNAGKDKMLMSILDPNREVAPQFQAFEVELKDGDSLIGLVGNETATSVTVRQAYGKEDVVLRSNIKQIKNQNQSLMPEGLEAGLKPQEVADLLEYVSTADAK